MNRKIRICAAVGAVLILSLSFAACRSSRTPGGETVQESVTDAPGQSGPTYEQQLAVACVGVLPFCFPTMTDFHIYIASDTAVDSKKDSRGVRIVLEDGGVTYTVYAYPIEALRTQSGTRDVYCPVLGYAALDVTEGEQLPAGNTWREVPYDTLDSLAGIVTGTQLHEH